MLSSCVPAQLSKLLNKALSADAIAEALTAEEKCYLAEHLHCLDDISLIWAAMDVEWEKSDADFRTNDETAKNEFYASPVWLLNGIFTEHDHQSQEHRAAIATFVVSREPSLVVDYGGGFGALARQIAAAAPETKLAVVEPHPFLLARRLAESFPNFTYTAQLPNNADVIIAQDVLEHVTDPLGHFVRLLDAIKTGGLVITANCFQPVIRCHYRGALHFHFTFRYIAQFCGCRFEGTVKGARHALVFRKIGPPNWIIARIMEKLSKTTYPGMLAAQKLIRALKYYEKIQD